MNGHAGADRPFSQRMGIEQKKEIQIDSMDDELRNRIWNVMDEFYFTGSCFHKDYHIKASRPDKLISEQDIIRRVFDGVFKEDAHEFRRAHEIKREFYELRWPRVYDFVEFLLSKFPLSGNDLQDRLNSVLEEESAGYRLIENKITRITNKLELDEVDNAQNTGIAEIDKHVESAILLLSDRENPDLGNAVKEAISAVEALCRKIAGDSDATLGQALSKIQSKNPKPIDSHLEDAVKKLYKFSNDASGVRHSHAEGKTQVGFDEAKFMVVTCSAIVNYLVKHAGPR